MSSDKMNERDHQALLRLAGHHPSSSSSSSSIHTTDLDVLHHFSHFIRPPPEQEDLSHWGARMAKRYYDKLHKEYVLASFAPPPPTPPSSQTHTHTRPQIGLRWRIEREVIEGKGQFICGNLACNAREGLASFEINFGYVEGGVKRNELVKIRLCRVCKGLLGKGKEREGGRKKEKEKEKERRREREEREKERERERERDSEGRRNRTIQLRQPPRDNEEVGRKRGEKQEQEQAKEKEQEEDEEDEASKAKKRKKAAMEEEMDTLIKDILDGKEA